MVVHVKTELNQFRVSRTDNNSPIILIGKKGIDYVLVDTIAATTNHVAIGDLIVWSTFPTEIEYCAATNHVVGIVPDTAENWASLAVNNPGVALTKELLFDATETIQIAIPIKPIVVAAKVTATTAITAGEAVMAGATGSIDPQDESSPTCGVAVFGNTSNTGTDSGAIILCPAYGLSTKT